MSVLHQAKVDARYPTRPKMAMVVDSLTHPAAIIEEAGAAEEAEDEEEVGRIGSLKSRRICKLR